MIQSEILAIFIKHLIIKYIYILYLFKTGSSYTKTYKYYARIEVIFKKLI